MYFYVRVNVTYIDKDGKRHPIKGKVGDNLMYLAHRHEIEMEG
jgi:ferredoxin-2, mitochondrial